MTYQQYLNDKNWLSVDELAKLKGISSRAVRKAIQNKRISKFEIVRSNDGKGRGGKVNFIHISDPYIKDHERKEYFKQIISNSSAPSGPDSSTEDPGLYNKEGKSEPDTGEVSSSPAKSSKNKQPNKRPPRIKEEDDLYEFGVYSKAPKWAKKIAGKYKELIDSTQGLKGNQLKQYIEAWNEQNPEMNTSYRSLLRARKRYKKRGIHGLLPKYGKSAGKSVIKPEWMDHFKYLYLKEGAPSAYSCWIQVRGKAYREDPQLSEFPSWKSFVYQLFRSRGDYRIPKDAIYFARYGPQAWDRKYGFSINRNYDEITCGEIWISDHAQLDVAVMTESGKTAFPWITAWRDMKSGKWLGWLLHVEAPNSDHIFQSFYYGVKQYGVPEHIYIDNGKDYRSKDFAGGRQNHRLEVDEKSSRSLVQYLGIRVHFALPYNASAKNIERDFLKIKESFSKQMPGYRGGNTVERPEVLAQEIKTGKLMHFDEFERLFNNFVQLNLNRAPSQGKILKGRCPDEAFQQEAELRVVSSEEHLKMLCMRSSRNYTIGRNGIKDSEIGKSYYAPWMSGMIGTEIFLRRDPKAWQDALVFRADDEEYLGRAEWAEFYNAPAIQKTDVDRDRVRDRIRAKKQQIKITKSYIETKLEQSPQEKMLNMAYGNESLNRERGYNGNGKPNKTKNIEFEELKKIDEKDEQERQFGKADYSKLVPEQIEKPRIFHSEAEKRIWEKEQQHRLREAEGEN